MFASLNDNIIMLTDRSMDDVTNTKFSFMEAPPTWIPVNWTIAVGIKLKASGKGRKQNMFERGFLRSRNPEYAQNELQKENKNDNSCAPFACFMLCLTCIQKPCCIFLNVDWSWSHIKLYRRIGTSIFVKEKCSKASMAEYHQTEEVLKLWF